MSFLITIVVALKALRRNAMRTALTALGMIIGVAAVIVMVAIGTGARTSIESQIQSAGSNLVMVNAGSGIVGAGAAGTRRGDDLDQADARRRCARRVQGIRYLSPTLNTRSQIVGEVSNWNTQIQGTNEELPAIRSWPLTLGAFFGAQEVASAAKVVVLGSVARDQLFGVGADPVGATVRINNQPFRVIGVLSAKGQAAMGPDQDDTAIVPFTTVQRKLLGVQHVSGILVSADDGVSLESVSAEVTSVLHERHRISDGEENDFMVRTQAEMTTMLTSTTNTMTYLLAGIAAVSLVVGGIGIMNIMLVSVTERTREIGLRLSVGARDLDVLTQFLVEAIVLSIAGGVIGIVLGCGRVVRRASSDAVADRRHGQLGAALVWRRRCDGRVLRVLSGEEGRGARPD